MKTTVKILILCVAIIIAIGCVMIYAKTKVAPPRDLESVAQYDIDLEEEIAKFKSIGSISESDNECDILLDRIAIYKAENKIDDEVNDENINSVLAIYMPRFLNISFGKFNNSKWNESDHAWMKGRIDKLTGVRLSDNSQAASYTAIDSMNLIKKIISDYNSAKEISKVSKFNGINNAKSTIASANKYATDPYLSHNDSLRNVLNDVKNNIHKSHLAQLKSKVDNMKKYKNYSNKEDFVSFVAIPVNNALEEYKNNAISLYGNIDTEKYNEYCDSANNRGKAANKYFEEKAIEKTTIYY